MTTTTIGEDKKKKEVMMMVDGEPEEIIDFGVNQGQGKSLFGSGEVQAR